MEDSWEDFIECELDKLERQQEQSRVIKFRELKINKWYKVIRCSYLMESAYGEYFIMNLEDVKNRGNVIGVFSIPRLIPEHGGLTGKYLKYRGKKEKTNKPGEYFHDYSIIKME